MKKYIAAVAVLIAMATADAAAQQDDTIVVRCSRYYYTEWYDECLFFGKNCEEEHPYSLGVSSMIYALDSTFNNRVLLNEHRAANHMAVKGIAAMTPVGIDTSNISAQWIPDTLTYKLPEYLMLFQGDSLMQLPIVTNRWPHSMRLLDSVRWDTAAPYVMRLPMCSSADRSDSSAWLTVLVYEAYFDQPLMVDSVFYVGGTLRNNFRRMNEPYTQVPTQYAYVHEFNYTGDECQGCDYHYGLFAGTYPFDNMAWDLWHNFNFTSPNFGPFLPIVDFYQIDAFTNEPNRGTVTGGGRFPAMSDATIAATPNEGYVFREWSDGSTDNPRTFTVTADVTVRAFFDPVGE